METSEFSHAAEVNIHLARQRYREAGSRAETAPWHLCRNLNSHHNLPNLFKGDAKPWATTERKEHNLHKDTEAPLLIARASNTPQSSLPPSSILLAAVPQSFLSLLYHLDHVYPQLQGSAMALPLQRPIKIVAALLAAVVLYCLYYVFGAESAPALLLHHIEPELVNEAHRLPTADSFLPHFRAVTEEPGMKMAEAKAGCNWSHPEAVNFQYVKETEWVRFERNDKELDLRRKQWQRYVLNDMIPYEPHAEEYNGRGIVIAAGDHSSMMRVKVILRALKKLGSEMAIELHYWNGEISEETKAEVRLMWPDVYFNDLAEPTNLIMPAHVNPKAVFKLPNYSFKSAALLNSRFAEPLLLDSDNIPVIRPEELYDSSTCMYNSNSNMVVRHVLKPPEDREYGTVFWPDIARTRPNNPMFAITNTACRKDEYEQESGQLLVDKRRFFYHLQLAAWFNNVHGTYYNVFLLGDKDMFRFAWEALKTPYGRPSRWLTSVGTLAAEDEASSYCGHTFAQHHPDHSDGRVAFLHGGLLKTVSKGVIRWQRENRKGLFQVYKRSARDEDLLNVESVNIKWDTLEYLPEEYRDPEKRVAWCTDMFDVEAQPLDEIVPHFEELFEEFGGYWMLED